ncbi:Ima1 N-terminal domain-containing protein [Amylostereum chailletii]|nr:Ima1 N-terminal domain-containing protein [Amylostereum chailletii]
MSTLLRRPPRVTCFFCQTSLSPAPQNPTSFLCPHCSCWNRYDANGEIMSDDPAMHDETLNNKSFARRASPRKDRFLTSFKSATFCNTCQSNQRLVVSLLSSYLPPSDVDPDYPRRIAEYNSYKASVEARYPPVCADCEPLVAEELRRKDVMARSNALGRWLKNTKHTDTRRQVTVTQRDRRKLDVQLWLWRARGLMFWMTLILVLAGDAAGSTGFGVPYLSRIPKFVYPLFIVVSILWMAWDPTYGDIRRAETQGRQIHVQGRKTYITLQVIVWFHRLSTAFMIAFPDLIKNLTLFNEGRSSVLGRRFFTFSLCFEVAIVVYAYAALHFNSKPSVRLLDTSRGSTPGPIPRLGSRLGTPSLAQPPLGSSSHSREATPRDNTPEPPSLGTASQRATSRPPGGNPIFGRPSLFPSSLSREASIVDSVPPPSTDNDSRMNIDEDPDAMDWAPTIPIQGPPITGPTLGERRGRQAPRGPASHDDNTGLEFLLERTNLAEEPLDSLAAIAPWPWRGRHPQRRWVWEVVLCSAALAIAGYLAWSSRRQQRLYILEYDNVKN